MKRLSNVSPRAHVLAAERFHCDDTTVPVLAKIKTDVGRLWTYVRHDRPFAMLRFRRMKTLQKFASVHANIHNRFSLERHLVDRQTYKERRSAALTEW